MILNNIKTRQKDSGFTIVELLVVIVVIGILAAITVASYSGITAKANTSTAKANADSVASVANTYAADDTKTGYPNNAATLAAYNGLAKVPTGVTVAAGSLNALTNATGATTILYQADTSAPLTGACVAYWDFSGSVGYKYLGTATAGNMNIASPTCD
ncbi:MAG: prepilin-type N-terminal cleavage/methylation domain-containing protein [Candidatus Saccharibacteria bacterium]|nr:prepilin-type N-terminal cleavage/methylation domain-containing protein [Candidatus Saccharibacteria bacterium]